MTTNVRFIEMTTNVRFFFIIW